MGILAETIFASVDTSPRNYTNYISISSFFPCPYRMYLTYTSQDLQPLTPRQILNMDDGHDQEEQAVQRLEAAGVVVKNRQKVVTVGRADTRGHIDGTIELGEEYLWEHKAMADDRFREFKATRLLTFPGYNAQVQAYMIGLGLKKCLFQVKNKDDNDIEDIVILLDVDYANNIISWVDSIVLEKWVPEPLKSEACIYCGMDCFGRILDFSKVASATVEEISKKWREGKMFQALGKSMEAEARAYLIGTFDKTGARMSVGLLGDKTNLVVDDLRVTKQISHRLEVDKKAIIELYGPEGLSKVTGEEEIVSYVIRDLRK